MDGEQSTFTFALHGNGIVHNRLHMFVFSIGSVGTADGDCWRCGGCGSRGSQKAGIQWTRNEVEGRRGASDHDGRNQGIWDVLVSRLDGRMRIGRLRSAARRICPIVAALQIPCSVGRGVPGRTDDEGEGVQASRIAAAGEIG